MAKGIFGSIFGGADSPVPFIGKPSLYSYGAVALNGSRADLAAHGGKVALVVNVASQCQHTPQYAELEKIWRDYGARGFVVLGFPSNEFGGQEPGTAGEISEFCTRNYGVTFPMMEKVQVLPGRGQHEIFAFLGKETGKHPTWNFGKYLVGRDGKPIEFYRSGFDPSGEEMRGAIERALDAKLA